MNAKQLEIVILLAIVAILLLIYGKGFVDGKQQQIIMQQLESKNKKEEL